MVTGSNLTALNPLVCKALIGTLGASLLVLGVFHQPWIPVEISAPETGVLVAMPEVRATVPFLPSSNSQTKPHLQAETPIEVPLAETSQEVPKSLPEPQPFVQTAEALPAKIDKPQPTERPLGKPTVAYQLPEAFQIPASEKGLVWSFVIPTGVQRDLYLTAAELRPGNKTLVKRMILSYDGTGTARQKDQETPPPGFASSQANQPESSQVLAEWTPGKSALPEKARRIPAGADLILTVEYAATPVPAPDPWSMGLYLTR